MFTGIPFVFLFLLSIIENSEAKRFCFAQNVTKCSIFIPDNDFKAYESNQFNDFLLKISNINDSQIDIDLHDDNFIITTSIKIPAQKRNFSVQGSNASIEIKASVFEFNCSNASWKNLVFRQPKPLSEEKISNRIIFSNINNTRAIASNSSMLFENISFEFENIYVDFLINAIDSNLTLRNCSLTQMNSSSFLKIGNSNLEMYDCLFKKSSILRLFHIINKSYVLIDRFKLLSLNFSGFAFHAQSESTFQINNSCFQEIEYVPSKISTEKKIIMLADYSNFLTKNVYFINIYLTSGSNFLTASNNKRIVIIGSFFSNITIVDKFYVFDLKNNQNFTLLGNDFRQIYTNKSGVIYIQSNNYSLLAICSFSDIIFYDFLIKATFSELILDGNELHLDHFQAPLIFVETETALTLKNTNFDERLSFETKYGLITIIGLNNQVSITKCSFTGVKFIIQNSFFLYLKKGIVLEIYDCQFRRLSTNSLGGGLVKRDTNDLSEVIYLNLINISVKDSQFEYPFLLLKSNCNLYLGNSSFEDITISNEKGGIVYADQGNEISMNRTSFKNFYLSRQYKSIQMKGCVVYAEKMNIISILFCEIFRVGKGQEGGVIFLLEENTLVLSSTSFILNECTDDRRALIFIYSLNTVELSGEIVIMNKNSPGNFLQFASDNQLTIEKDSRILVSNQFNNEIINFEKRANKIVILQTTISFINCSQIRFLVFSIAENEARITNSRLYFFGSIALFVSSYKLNLLNITSIDSTFIDSDVIFIDDHDSLVNIKDININCKYTSSRNQARDLGGPEYIFYFSEPVLLSIERLNAYSQNYAGIVNVMDCKTDVTILDCLFINNSISKASSLLKIQSSKNILIQNCIFFKNKGYLNGTINILVEENPITIIYNIFLGNIALSKSSPFSRGSGLSLNSERNEYFLTQLNASLNIFYDNYADYGSAIYLDIHLPLEELTRIETGNLFQNNSVLCGYHISTRISFINLEQESADESRVLDPSKELFKISVEDYLGKNFSCFDFVFKINATNSENYEISVINRDYQVLVNFKNISESFISYKTSKDDILEIKENITFFIEFRGNNYSKNLYVKRNYQCLSGQFLNIRTFACESCPENTMKIKKNAARYCENCDRQKAFECKGGNNLILREGYYRYKNSSQIFKCKNLKACKESKCSLQYDENSFLCSVCKPEYGMTADWECIMCNKGTSHMFLVFGLLFQFFIRVYSANKAYKLTKNLKKKKVKKQSKYSIFDLASTNSCLKIMNIHLSFTLSLLSYPFRAIDQLTKSSGPMWISIIEPFKFSYECLFKDLGIPYYGVYSNLFVKMTIPVTILIFMLIYYSVKIYIKKQNRGPNKENAVTSMRQRTLKRDNFVFFRSNTQRQAFLSELILELMNKHSFESIILIALSLSYEDLISGFGYILFYFKSKEDEREINRMLHEPIRDWDNYPNQIYVPITIGLMVFFGIIVPIYIITRLKIRRRKQREGSRMITSSDTSRINTYTLFCKYGYFYYPYNKNCYYFEIFYMLKRVVYITYNIFIIPLLSIHTKYEENLVMFINLEIIFLWTFFLIHKFMHPYRKELVRVNSLENRSNSILLTSFFLSALFFNNVDSEDSKDIYAMKANMYLYGGIYAVNMLFLVNVLILLYQNEKHNIKSFLHSWFLKYIYKLNLSICRCFKRTKRNSESNESILNMGFELNPLADLEGDPKKKNQKPLRVMKADKKIVFYRKKIKVLSLLVKLQKKEIKKLKLLHSGAGYIERSMDINEDDLKDGINKFKDFQPGVVLKPEGNQQIFLNQFTLDPNQNIVDFDEYCPNKVNPDNNFNQNTLQGEARLTGRECTYSLDRGNIYDEIEFPNNEVLSRTLPQNVINFVADDVVHPEQINSVIGTELGNYFLKVKLNFANPFEIMKIQSHSFENADELFVKIKEKEKIPVIWLKEEIIKLVLYIRPKEKWIPNGFFLKINDESNQAVKLKIALEASDFVKVSYFHNDQHLNSEKEKYEFMPFNHKIQKSLGSEKQIDLNAASFDNMKFYFPELYDNGEELDIEDFDEEEENQERRPSKVRRKALFKEKTANAEQKTDITFKRYSFHSEESNNPKYRMGKVDLINFNSFLFMEVWQKDSYLNFIFRDLYVKLKRTRLLQEDSFRNDIINLLNKFIECRKL